MNIEDRADSLYVLVTKSGLKGEDLRNAIAAHLELYKDDKIKVIELEQTCFACPSQWDGKTNDKKHVYIRYRFGCLSVDVDNKQVHSISFGNSLSGVLDTEEMQKQTESLIDWSEVKYVND